MKKADTRLKPIHMSTLSVQQNYIYPLTVSQLPAPTEK